MNFLKKIGFDYFILAIILMIVLAYYFPQLGTIKEPFSLEKISTNLISVIFFFYGVKMGPEKFKTGLSDIKMHFLIQAITFIIFPVFIILMKAPLSNSLGYDMWLAIFYLSALPSTVSSSVVMISIAKGNVAGGIFNASLSSLFGIIITPLWMSLYVASAKNMEGVMDIVIKLFLQIVLPIIIGILLNKKLGEKAEKRKNQLKLLDQSIILLIIYTSFCHTFSEGYLSQVTTQSIITLVYVMFILFVTIMAFTFIISRIFKLNTENTITTLFCGSKKSLVHGTAMSKVLFATSGIGIMLLPIMIYHSMQIFLTSIMANKFAQRDEILK